MKTTLHWLLSLSLLSGCFVPVDLGAPDGGSDAAVEAIWQLPGVLLVVDRSGSLLKPIRADDPRCRPACGPGDTCPSECPTRLSELRRGLSAAVTAVAGKRRLGLILFPHTNAGCYGPDTLQVDPTFLVGDEVTGSQEHARRVRAEVDGLVANGGTPTMAALEFANAVGPADARTVVLISDGLPNCNDANVNNTCRGANVACRCTLGPLSACQNAGSTAFQPCSHGCLDEGGVRTAAQRLVAQGRRVFVIALGADVQVDEARWLFNEVTRWGNTALSCPNGLDSECTGHGWCDRASGVCSQSHYMVEDGDGLSAALAEVFAQAR